MGYITNNYFLLKYNNLLVLVLLLFYKKLCVRDLFVLCVTVILCIFDLYLIKCI